MSAAPPGRGSLRRRLLVQLLGGSAFLAVALFLIVQSFALRLAEESQDNILAASAASILDAATIEGGELALDLPYSAFSMLENLHDDAVYYAIRADGDFVTGYDDLPAMVPVGNTVSSFVTRQYRGQDVRIVTAERSLASGEALIRLTASVGQTRLGQQITLTRISRQAAALGLGFFAAAAALAVISARLATAPMERLADSVTRRGPEDLRPVTSSVPSEMVPLVAALNRFMARLETSLARSEDFIAEAAHRVRTPLATVRMQAEVTLHRVEKEENRKSIREMIRAVDESSRAAGQLLDHAMVTFRTDHLDESIVDLGTLAVEVADRLGPTADLRDISVDTSIETGVQVVGDPVLIQNALRNVLDNAIKYSHPDSRIEIMVFRQNGFGVIRMTDEGIGFPASEPGALTQRFARGANVEDVVGSGLGLTIADEVARAHGGGLDITNNSEGPGACVSLRFSLA